MEVSEHGTQEPAFLMSTLSVGHRDVENQRCPGWDRIRTVHVDLHLRGHCMPDA